jgi:hypothetical protein
VKPSEELPRVIGFARSVLLTAATTAYECNLATSIKMGGGIKKRNFLSSALLAFKNSTKQASPKDFVHPALVGLIK